MTVQEILESKPNKIPILSPNQTIFDALEELTGSDEAAVLIVDAGSVVGIFSEKDYIKRVVMKGLGNNTKLKEVMTTMVKVVSPNFTAEDCMRAMSENNLRHLPVVDNNQVIGFLNIIDVIKSVLSKKEQVIVHLEKYVSKTWPL
ncbi:MAG: CBS domain-containing protein [Bdellovibrionales bacterium]|nr:CBS domain-containing protein [Bdellovibrionales bacterium]